MFIHRIDKHHKLSKDEKANIAKAFDEFYSAIRDKHFVKIKYRVIDGEYEKDCIPFDYGIYRKRPYNVCFHARTVNVEDGDYTLHIQPSDIIEIKKIDKQFNPSDYIDWEPPFKWYIPRDWGNFS